VYVAIHKKSQRQVACKIIDMKRSMQQDEVVSEPAASTGYLSNRVTNQSMDAGSNVEKRRAHIDRSKREADVLKGLDHVSSLKSSEVLLTDTASPILSPSKAYS
jgi:hypothetical protein